MDLDKLKDAILLQSEILDLRKPQSMEELEW